MKHSLSLQEKKKHGEIRFPFNIYPCTIPGDFPQVALHWQMLAASATCSFVP